MPINALYILKLSIYKYSNKITKPIIHYYAICWNEEKMLPFMLDYYDQFVDKIYIYDNYSTDNSNKILAERNKIEVIKFETNNSINDMIYNDIKNNCWKKSRGKADYVIVCDVDEFLYHPQIKDFLMNCFKKKYSFFIPKGYNMYAETFPQYDSKKLLIEIYKDGIQDTLFCKSIIFDPHRIVEINYTAGAHFCYPWGIVKTKEDEKLKLLHYKNLGVEYVLKRCNLYRKRLSKSNIDNDFGIHYLQEDETITKEINLKLQSSKPII